MSQVRIKKRQWRPKPSDEPPKPRGKIRLIRLEPDPKVERCSEKSQTDVSQLAGVLKDPKVQKCSEKSQTKADVSQLAGFLRYPKVQKCPEKSQTKADVSQLAGFLRDPKVQKCSEKSQTKADVSQLAGFLRDPKVQKCSEKSQTKADVSQLAGFLRDPKVQKCSEKSQTKADVSQLAGFLRYPNGQKSSEKSQTKADVSQLAGFLRKRHSPETTMATNGEKSTCNMTLAIKPESHASDVTITTGATCDKRILSDMVHISPQASSSVQNNIRSEHGTDLGPDTKPVCNVTADKKTPPQIELDDDFDYSLDLMGDYTLTESDFSKKPTPFWFEIECNATNDSLQNIPVKQATPDNLKTDHSGPSSDTTNYHLVKQFSPESDLITNKVHDSTRHSGVKRKLSLDEGDVVPVPCKRPRRC